MTPKAVAFWSLALGVFLVDRVGKTLVVRGLEPGDRIDLVAGWLSVVHVRVSATLLSSSGGLGPTTQLVLLGAIALVTVVLVFAFLRALAPGERSAAAALGAVLGGVLGNVFDRLLHGAGIEFLHLGPIAATRLPDFDLCDVAIVLGLVTLTVELLASELASRAEERRRR